MRVAHPKLLLVHAPHSFGWPWGKGNVYRGYYEYLGTGYLAAACEKAGYSVEIIDAPYNGWGPEKTAEEIGKRRFDVLGVSANWQEFFPHAAALITRLGRINAPFLLGGHFPSIVHKELLRDFPQIDAVCLGEGENTMVDVLDALSAGRSLENVPGIALQKSSDGEVSVSELRPMIQDLDRLPFPKRPHAEVFRTSKNPGLVAANILSSRGCGGACSFCTVHAFQSFNPGPGWRARSPENVVDEIQFLNTDYGFTQFRFVDEDFFGRRPSGRERAVEIAREILKRGLRISWELYCRADEVDRDLLRILQEAGLRAVYLSLDAVSEGDIELYNKGTPREVMKDAVRAVIDSGVELYYSFIFWHPYRRLSEIQDAFSLLEEACGNDQQLYRKVLKGLQTGIISDLVVLTGSPIEEKIRSDGLLHGSYREHTYDFVDQSTAAAYKLMKLYKKVWNTGQNAWNSLTRPK